MNKEIIKEIIVDSIKQLNQETDFDRKLAMEWHKFKMTMDELVKSEIWDTLIESLPSDAENLSTLTNDQAKKVLVAFMEKLK